MKNNNLKLAIDSYKNFPQEGIVFRDVLPILGNPDIFSDLIYEMSSSDVLRKSDAIIAIDARGFIFGAAISFHISKPLVVARKPGKLPGEIITKTYVTEYSEDELSIQLGTGKVIIVDDVLATGGTLSTVNSLCISAGYDVRGSLVLIDLKYVPRSSAFINIASPFIKSLIQYE